MSLPSSTLDWSQYRFPAEWEKHEATWLAWPHNEGTWPGLMEPVRETYLEIIRELIPGERVYLCVNDCAAADEVGERLRKAKIQSPNLKLVTIPTDDAWLRDSGPIFMLRRQPGNPARVAHDFGFNGWGQKYQPWDSDDRVPLAACPMTDTPFETHDYILEGGSIDTDGRDTLLTTEHCLLNKNRNPSLSRAEIESKLKHWLGMKQIIWLGDGLEGDDTDGHVDDLSRFVAPGVVVTAIEKDPQDTNFAPLKDNWERLQKAKDSRGQPLRVLELPMPPRSDGPHHRNPASHANFYIANSAVLVPVFNSPTDRPTLELLRPFFPDRKVVGIDCSALVGGLGAIHCVTQQMPAIPA